MLGWMAKEFFASSPVLFYPIVALIIFTVTFSLLTIRAFLRPKSSIVELAALPLADDTGEAS